MSARLKSFQSATRPRLRSVVGRHLVANSFIPLILYEWRYFASWWLLRRIVWRAALIRAGNSHTGSAMTSHARMRMGRLLAGGAPQAGTPSCSSDSAVTGVPSTKRRVLLLYVVD